MVLTIKTQTLQQKNGMLLTLNKKVGIHTKIQSNFAVVGGDDNAKVSFGNFAPFRKCRTEINDTFLMKQNILILQCLCTIWLNTMIIIQILQEVYGSLKEMKN